jgi:hypothetical protein
MGIYNFMESSAMLLTSKKLLNKIHQIGKEIYIPIIVNKECPRFHKMWGITCVAEDLLVSQEGWCSMVLDGWMDGWMDGRSGQVGSGPVWFGSVGWLVGWLVGWFIRSLVGLVGWLVGWLVKLVS